MSPVLFVRQALAALGDAGYGSLCYREANKQGMVRPRVALTSNVVGDGDGDGDGESDGKDSAMDSGDCLHPS